MASDAVGGEEVREEREGETATREETSWDGVRVVRVEGALGGVLGAGVREVGGTGRLWPRRGLPESDWARERMSCCAAE